MVPPPSLFTEPPGQSEELLQNDEVVVIVDDFSDLVHLLQEFLTNEHLPVITACSAAELRTALAQHHVALVLLDIGLPDANGMELLPELVEHPDLSVIMLTAVSDLQTALSCMRLGADDYLTKPVNFADLLATLNKVLEKRRLKINNRLYQHQLEQARFRLLLSHELALKMNSAFLSVVELDEILQAILVGITAEEGLQFNRAFLALFNDEGTTLQGRMAIGPASREDGGHIWKNIEALNLDFHDLLSCSNVLVSDREVNRIVKALQVDVEDEEHIFIKAVKTRKPINVVQGKCSFAVPLELMGLLQEDSFVVVPLFSSTRSLGVIIADHYISNKPITDGRIKALESFASQASLAIEHCHLHMDMKQKIQQLESMARELEKNKDLLVESERYSVVGHVAAQLAHNIRNPITSIGGTARLLAKRTHDSEWLQFLNMMTSEAEKIEGILEDLFNFVESVQPDFQQVALFSLLNKSILLHYNSLKENRIQHSLHLPEDDLLIYMDERLMQKVFVHLLRNAIEAMPGGGELTVEVSVEKGKVMVSIADTGKTYCRDGENPKQAASFTTQTAGVSMGLALVHRILEDHQGSLVIQEGENGGTKALVTLPM
ncbi:MAG: histidine kinase [Desulfobulbus propionicus]|nr:MAG: histidine kinase [Desulfobulbus propionicus]